MMGKSQGAAAGAKAAAAATDQKLDILSATRLDGSNLPRAPKSAFRKRPVRLDYDKNEFWQFRLPSENHFLMGAFDSKDVFGKKEGLNHSPHIAAQMSVDHSLLLGALGVTFLMVTYEISTNAQFSTLRENFRTTGYGRFEADDFIEKKQ